MTKERSTAPPSTLRRRRSGGRPTRRAKSTSGRWPRPATAGSRPRSRRSRRSTTPRTTTSSIWPRTPAGTAESAAPACPARRASQRSAAKLAYRTLAGFRLPRLSDARVKRPPRLREYAAEHRLEEGERERLAGGVEGRSIEPGAELLRASEPRVVPELLAHVPVAADVVEEIVALEDAVLLHHPVVLLRHEGLHDRRGDVRMVVGPEGVADVVQQRADHVFLVAAVA